MSYPHLQVSLYTDPSCTVVIQLARDNFVSLTPACQGPGWRSISAAVKASEEVRDLAAAT
jgi:hypothetical protein